MPEDEAGRQAQPAARTRETSPARAVFGGRLGKGLPRIGALAVKVLLSVVIAFVLYEAMIFSFVALVFGSPTVYEKLINDANTSLKDSGINVVLCLEAPVSSVINCGEKLKDAVPSIYEPWLSFGVTDKGGKTERVEFAVNHQFVVSNPKIVNSTHSLARIVERAHQAKYEGAVPEDATSNLKLCAGTRKVLDDPTCTKISIALKTLSERVSADLNSVRILALFFGIIQFAVFVVFWYIVIECWLTWRQLISAPVVFFQTAPDGSIDVVDDLGTALDKYNALENRSPGDRLMARLIQASSRAPSAGASLSSSVLEDFREFQVSETEGIFGSLDIANEAMLKLAFVGTIWGIGSALFLVRELDSVDSVQRIVSKSDMFAGIGVGFGTTLVGVLLSIVASFQIQNIARRWEEHVNVYYRTILNDSKNVISSYVTNLPSGPKPHIQHRLVVPPDRPGFFSTIGLLALLFAVLAVIYSQRESLILAVSQLWSRVSGG